MEVHCDLVLVLSFPHFSPLLLLLAVTLTLPPFALTVRTLIIHRRINNFNDFVNNSNSFIVQLDEQAEAIELANSVLIEVKFIAFFTFSRQPSKNIYFADFKSFRQKLAVQASDPIWVVQERKLQEHHLRCKYSHVIVQF